MPNSAIMPIIHFEPRPSFILALKDSALVYLYECAAGLNVNGLHLVRHSFALQQACTTKWLSPCVSRLAQPSWCCWYSLIGRCIKCKAGAPN
jgi:hypothetical protein